MQEDDNRRFVLQPDARLALGALYWRCRRRVRPPSAGYHPSKELSVEDASRNLITRTRF